jgi:hypothetical protein
MTYDDCPNCQNGLHDKCETSPEYDRFICTCSVCNALAYHREVKKAETDEQKKHLEETLQWHINNMTHEEHVIYINKIQLA